MRKGLNLGFVNQIPLQDCQEWCPAEDIERTPTGVMRVNKERALQNLETTLLNSSPRTRNTQQVQPRFYTTMGNERGGFPR